MTYKAKRKTDGKMFAMKSIPAKTLTDQELLKLQNELLALSKMQSEHSIDYVETFLFKDNYFIVSELIETCSLASLIRGKNGIQSEEFCSYILYCIAKGIKALHDLNVIHRGVSSENIYCIGEQVKLNDTTRSMFLTEQEAFRTSKIYFKNYYPPPETLSQTPSYGKAIDIWSLGSLAFELATGKTPHTLASFKRRENSNIASDSNPIQRFQLLQGQQPRSQEYQDFIKKCAEVDP